MPYNADQIDKKEGMNQTQIAQFVQLATALTGMMFSDSRLTDLTLAVRNTIEQLGMSTADELYTALALTNPDPTILRTFISHLTIGETHFFRNQPQFGALATTILPEIIERRRSQRRLRIWSAACATGEEPYSIAILLDQLLPDFTEWDVSILATDIDWRALERAQQGLYSAWSFRQMDETVRTQYFARCDRLFQISPTIRRRVRFSYLNLSEASYPSLLNNTTQIDLILCRNVLIYLAPEITRSIANRLYHSLNEGGWLLVGHAEPSQEIFAQYETINLPGTVAYRRQSPPLDLWLSDPQTQTANRTAMNQPSPAKTPRRPAPSPPPTHEALLQLANEAHAPGQPTPQAEAEQQLLIRANDPKDDGIATYILAQYYAEHRQWAQAEQWLRRALKRKPLLAQAHYLYALLLLEANQTDAAITAARRCIYVDANYVAGHLLLALLHRRCGDQRRSLNALTQARSLLRQMSADAIVADSGGATARQLLAATEQQIETIGARPTQ
jgi:chemotaxis protein methyltransferase CheR